jgi:hypothetical protein
MQGSLWLLSAESSKKNDQLRDQISFLKTSTTMSLAPLELREIWKESWESFKQIIYNNNLYWEHNT